MTTCTSAECPMREECYRVVSDNDNCQDRFNYEYTCNEYSGFSDFVSAKLYQKKKSTGVYEWIR